MRTILTVMNYGARSSILALLAGLVPFFLPHTTFATAAARQAAIEFAKGWGSNIEMLGISGLTDARALKEYSAQLDPHRKVIRESGSKALQGAAEQLDTLMTYVARSISEDNDAWLAKLAALGETPAKALPPEKVPPRPPTAFRDAKLNALLGIEAHEDPYANPRRITAVLHLTMVRFTRAAGVYEEMLPQIRDFEKEQTEALRDSSAKEQQKPRKQK